MIAPETNTNDDVFYQMNVIREVADVLNILHEWMQRSDYQHMGMHRDIQRRLIRALNAVFPPPPPTASDILSDTFDQAGPADWEEMFYKLKNALVDAGLYDAERR